MSGGWTVHTSRLYWTRDMERRTAEITGMIAGIRQHGWPTISPESCLELGLENFLTEHFALDFSAWKDGARCVYCMDGDLVGDDEALWAALAPVLTQKSWVIVQDTEDPDNLCKYTFRKGRLHIQNLYKIVFTGEPQLWVRPLTHIL